MVQQYIAHESVQKPVFIGPEDLQNLEVALGRQIGVFVKSGVLLEREESSIREIQASGGNNIPPTQRGIYQRRLTEIRPQLEQRRKLAAAFVAGYDPYTVPKSFAVGFVETPTADLLARRGMKDLRALVFNAPIPPEHMHRFIAARALGVFDEIVVASSDRSLFREVQLQFTPPAPPAPKSIYVDPFLVGLIAAPEFFGRDMQLGMKGGQVSSAVGFLISQWDLSHELKS